MQRSLLKKIKPLTSGILAAVSVMAYAQGKKEASASLKDLKAPSKNFIINGSFNAGLKGWSHNGNHRGQIVKEGRDGGNCYKISGKGKGTALCYNIVKGKADLNLQEGKTYTLSAWFKAENINPKKLFTGGVLFVINTGWSKHVSLGPGEGTTDGWIKRTLTFTPPKQSKKYAKNGYCSFLISYPEGAPGTVWIDDIQIEEGDKATEYSDFWNIEIAKMIKKMKNSVENINATQQVLKETLPDSYKQNETYKKLDKLLSKLEQAGGKLKNYDKLSKTEMAALVRNVDNTSSEVTKLIENL